jgi:hypothetical protein
VLLNHDPFTESQPAAYPRSDAGEETPGVSAMLDPVTQGHLDQGGALGAER